MKKQILVGASLALLATGSAYASKARLGALGGSLGGSHYIKDARNIFLNPALVNTYKDYVTTEWGANANNAATDAEATPAAEGGFFRAGEAVNYGIYLGNTLDSQNTAKGTAGNYTGGVTFLPTTDNLDLFVGGDAGIEWGARLHYGANKVEAVGLTQKNSNLGLGLGMIMGDLSASVNLAIKNETEGSSALAADKFEADLGTNVNVSYALGDMTVYADFTKTGYEATVAGVANDAKRKDTTFDLGVAKIHDVSSAGRVYMSFGVSSTTTDAKVLNGTSVKTKVLNLPLNIGYEHAATSWLTLRGNIAQAVLLNSRKVADKKQASNSTDVNAGATLNFGKLKVDGLIGTNAAAGDNGQLRLDNVLTRVGVSYWF